MVGVGWRKILFVNLNSVTFSIWENDARRENKTDHSHEDDEVLGSIIPHARPARIMAESGVDVLPANSNSRFAF